MRWMDGSGNSSLDQLGNWGRWRLDGNGNGGFNDTGEVDDTRTHNVVNELTARDTDSNASTNYTPSYDAAGNLTDDNEACKYEYSAFGQLRRVKNQATPWWPSTATTAWGTGSGTPTMAAGQDHLVGIVDGTNLSKFLDRVTRLEVAFLRNYTTIYGPA